MTEELKMCLIFLIGIFSAYFGSFSSGGVSVLGVGLLTLLGISPQMATITFKLGKIGDVLGGVFLFHKNGNIPKKFILGGGLASLTGSFIGSYWIFSIPDFVIYFVSAIGMFVLTGFSWYRKIGLKNTQPISKIREIIYYFSLIGVTMFGNIFIAGSGVWYYFWNTFLLRLSTLDAKGYSTAISFFWFFGTLFGILAQGRFMLSWAIALALGMFIGGYLGTKHVISLGNATFRKLLLFSIVLFAFYFLYLGYNSWSNF